MSNKRWCGLLTVAAGVMTCSLASAQDATDETAMVSFPFGLVDRVDGTTSADAELGLTVVSGDSSVFGLRADLFYQQFDASGLGFFASLPATAAFATGDNSDSAAGLGNLDLGAAYAKRAKQVGFVLHGGLNAPTATKGDDGAASNVINSFNRISDFVLIAPRQVYLRLSASGILSTGNVFVRGDLGFDIPVWHGEDFPMRETVTHLNLGIGAMLQPRRISAAFEFSTVSAYADSQSTIAITVGFPVGAFVSLVVPIDDGARGEIFVLKGGFRFGDEKDQFRGAIAVPPTAAAPVRAAPPPPAEPPPPEPPLEPDPTEDPMSPEPTDDEDPLLP